MRMSERIKLADLITVLIVGTVGYLMVSDCYRRTFDRWHRQDMIDWRTQFQQDNPHIKVPWIEPKDANKESSK